MKPLVSVVVATYLKDNQRYLDQCIRSLQAQEGVDFEVTLVSSGEYIPSVPKQVLHVHSDQRMHYPSAINYGVKCSSPESKCIMLLNDDTILAKHTLATMAAKCVDQAVIMNAASNCDNGWWYQMPMDVSGIELRERFYTIDGTGAVLDFTSDVIHKQRGPNVIVRSPYVCFYGTMIPRMVWDAVGSLDENYKTGHDDEDYCYRAAQKGVVCFTDLESFIFHYGGISANAVITDDERRANLRYFESKWKT